MSQRQQQMYIVHFSDNSTIRVWTSDAEIVAKAYNLAAYRNAYFGRDVAVEKIEIEK